MFVYSFGVGGGALNGMGTLSSSNGTRRTFIKAFFFRTTVSSYKDVRKSMSITFMTIECLNIFHHLDL